MAVWYASSSLRDRWPAGAYAHAAGPIATHERDIAVSAAALEVIPTPPRRTVTVAVSIREFGATSRSGGSSPRSANSPVKQTSRLAAALSSALRGRGRQR
jgi:hypothetical protein